jgi:gluconolactonase
MFSKVAIALLATNFASAAMCQPATSATPATAPAVVRLDAALDALVSVDARIELAAGGFGFTEGPVWVPDGAAGYLLFTDVPGNVVYKLAPGERKATVYLSHAGFDGPDIWRWGGMNSNGFEPNDPRHERFPMIGPDGLAIDREGRLLMATFTGRSIDRIEKDGRRTVLADRHEGRRFNGTTDLVVKSDGAVYFTDTFGGLRLRDKDPRKELETNAVFRWKDGRLTLLAKDMPNTNGLAFSPDEKYLYVNGSRDNYINRYEVMPDGTLAKGALFIDLKGHAEPGVTDGMRVDARGNLYVSGPGGVWIVSPEGTHLGTIRTPEHPIHMAFGDADRKTLYIAAHTSIYKIRLVTGGR